MSISGPTGGVSGGGLGTGPGCVGGGVSGGGRGGVPGDGGCCCIWKSPAMPTNAARAGCPVACACY